MKQDIEESILSADKLSELRNIIEGNDFGKESDLIEWIEDNCMDANIFYEEEISVIKQNTMFLTKKEAKDHLKANSHHYSKKAHTFAMTAWRAPKVANY